mmetsp:Transcript_148759/g.477769  ORF Transcript_148759/g.477769 Transcript_148759/m.477769 type:complete len:274 (+) Transcript_148759:749-1570(+)
MAPAKGAATGAPKWCRAWHAASRTAGSSSTRRSASSAACAPATSPPMRPRAWQAACRTDCCLSVSRLATSAVCAAVASGTAGLLLGPWMSLQLRLAMLALLGLTGPLPAAPSPRRRGGGGPILLEGNVASNTLGSTFRRSAAYCKDVESCITAASTTSWSARRASAAKRRAWPFCATAASTMLLSLRNSSAAYSRASPLACTAVRTSSLSVMQPSSRNHVVRLVTRGATQHMSPSSDAGLPVAAATCRIGCARPSCSTLVGAVPSKKASTSCA